MSGIRGQIKKALSKPPGAFRATFEDKIKKSDIVFCRTWYPIEVPKFYNPVSSLLLAPEQKTAWEGMKTLGQLKRERNVKNEAEADSMYTVIFFSFFDFYTQNSGSLIFLFFKLYFSRFTGNLKSLNLL